MVKMVETGLLRLDDFTRVAGRYKLQEWEAALDMAANEGGMGVVTVFEP